MLGSATQQNVTKFILCSYASRFVKTKNRSRVVARSATTLLLVFIF